MRHGLIRKRQPAPNSSHAEFACGGLTATATDALVPGEVDSLTALS